MLDVRVVGLAPAVVPYAEGWELQRRVHDAVVAGSPDTLLLLEHEPVFTAGARTDPAERPTDGTAVVDVDRGGKITWHGPGQLVGYPILRLPEPVDVVSHVRRLERVLISAVADLGVAARQVAGRSGVWVSQDGHDAKIAAIGVRVQRGVTMHGFALNCDNDLAPFEQIIPCGITDAGVASLSTVLDRRVSPADVVDTVTSRFRAEFETAAAA
ncbi:lipoyl(octanoyl) transferase LipB [Microbacterium sp. Yaish 1]|uniref:lipoyl(octanoyl) transferase LipB n=1 Tax=Microbacterium sp. Yaish 1 TaxID=2025014 RepID=UPI000B93FAED|nr:lipoyl(octanoyl) transferase LipB [Microbacterium sp. Yaish 1]OYC95305.1 lipoate--protein ligase B [Microbacterium sp. Yaish 1]